MQNQQLIKFKEELLLAPSSQLSDSAKSLISDLWVEDEISALYLLKILDYCVHGSECSDFVVKMLNIILENIMLKEKTTYDSLILQAEWRKRC